MVVLTTSLFKVITVIVKNNLIRIIAHHKTKVTMVGFLEPRRCNSRAMAVILLAQLGVENSGCAPDFNLLNHDVSRLECRQRVVCRRLRYHGRENMRGRCELWEYEHIFSTTEQRRGEVTTPLLLT